MTAAESGMEPCRFVLKVKKKNFFKCLMEGFKILRSKTKQKNVNKGKGFMVCFFKVLRRLYLGYKCSDVNCDENVCFDSP